MRIVLIGASGFLGRYVVQALGTAGHQCMVLSRQPARRRALALLPNTRLWAADPSDPMALARHLEGADAAVSMAGILNEPGRDGSGFRAVHLGLVEALLAACRDTGVRRILHVSAIGAGTGQSHYLRSKGEAEQALRDSALPVSVFRPSVVFGPGDSFFNRFAGLLRMTPVLPLACPRARLQPVYAGDVATAMRGALEQPPAGFEVFELGGPRQYSLQELVLWTAGVLGLERKVPGLPDSLSRLQAGLMDFLPGKPFSSDNYRSLQSDNVTSENPWPRWGVRPSSVESVVPGYLGLGQRQQRLAGWRRRAGRG